jgi:serine/threonine-protein kinase
VEERGARFCPHCGDALELAPARPKAGDTFNLAWGKVVLEERIGEGGMGIVYRAWAHYDPSKPASHRPSHPVAAKLLSPLLRGSKRARRLLLGEAAALDRLSHPNIVRFHGLIQNAVHLGLVMELVEGEALDQVIGRWVRQAAPGGLPAMPMVRAWHYFSQLLGALAATHALGIVHRDVKPSNVLCRTDGLVKLTDFGIARVPADEVRLTGGLAPGTGAYMAPEQIRGEEPDARTDIYSAAIVLFEMLTGVTPFGDLRQNELAIRAAQLERSPPPLTHFVPQAPAVVDVLLARALAKDPMHRFSSCLEMGDALRRALGLPDTPGWQAQRELAQRAMAVSRATAEMNDAPRAEVSAEEANQLRTDVMSAYRS